MRLTCREVIARLSDFISAVSSGPSTWLPIIVHLAGCAPCRAYLRTLRATIRVAGRAAAVRGLLARRQESETRRVLQAVFAERIEFAPFNEAATRGYQFIGNGSYGQILLGDTCPTSERGPNGIWQWDVFPVLPFEGRVMAA